jgi:hypothetical protein
MTLTINKGGGKTQRALRRMDKPSADPVPEPCSSCGNNGVLWTRVRNVTTDRTGWRWRCSFCRSSRFLEVAEDD